MYNLLIGNYNNYFNRIVKKEETDFRYFTVMGNTTVIKNINFNPNDGVFTQVILGKGDYLLPESATRPIQPDYAVLYKTELENPPYIDAKIISRWFIIEAVRTRSGQYQLTLKRDVLVDNYSDVVSAPIYLEKGYINNINNPLLYNKEGLALNQIKQYEIPLKDETESGWIVGYIPQNWAGETIQPKAIVPANADITVAGLSNWSYYKYCTLNPSYKPCWGDTKKRSITVKYKGNYYQGSTHWWNKGRWTWDDYTSYSSHGSIYQNVLLSKGANPPSGFNEWASLSMQGDCSPEDSQRIFSNVAETTTFNEYINKIACYVFDLNRGNYDAIIGLAGKTIYDSVSGLYYKIKIEYTTQYQRTGSSAYRFFTDGTAEETNIAEFVSNNLVRTGISVTLSGNIAAEDIGLNASQNFPYIVLEQNAIDVECEIDAQRAHLQDAPYDMFCIPFSDKLKIYDGTDTFTCSKTVALSMATAIGEKGGEGSVYDVQLLPYCPIREAILRSDNPSDTLDITTISYDIIKQRGTNAKLSAVLWSPRSDFSFEINQLDNINYCQFKEPTTPITGTTIPYYKYLFINDDLPENPDDVPGRLGFGSVSGDKIKVYKVNKSTGLIIENVGNVNTIEIIEENGSLKIDLYKSGDYQHPIYKETTAVYNEEDWKLLFYLDDSSYGGQYVSEFVKYMSYPKQTYYDVDLSSPLAAKVTNECNLYRLSSGNQSSMFEFSPAKSFGFNGYKIDCTYKPFQPWIHIIPKLGGLYGEDFVTIDDCRGLVLGGDYSVTQLTNTWATYKLQNSTYQEMFDREIKHMDVGNSIAQQEQLFKSISGSVTGGVTGGVAGGMVGGVWGAVAGAAVGTGAGIAGGVMDYENMLKMQEENKDYARDRFNYSLQNMQAIPSGLSKTSAFVYNTRVWPFLEVYTCTDVEKEAFINKIKYDGMTIMAIGKIADYLDSEEQHYFKGRVIRFDGLEDDSHIANEIYNELLKGAYL